MNNDKDAIASAEDEEKQSAALDVELAKMQVALAAAAVEYLEAQVATAAAGGSSLENMRAETWERSNTKLAAPPLEQQRWRDAKHAKSKKKHKKRGSQRAAGKKEQMGCATEAEARLSRQRQEARRRQQVRQALIACPPPTTDNPSVEHQPIDTRSASVEETISVLQHGDKPASDTTLEATSSQADLDKALAVAAERVATLQVARRKEIEQQLIVATERVAKLEKADTRGDQSRSQSRSRTRSRSQSRSRSRSRSGSREHSRSPSRQQSRSTSKPHLQVALSQESQPQLVQVSGHDVQVDLAEIQQEILAIEVERDLLLEDEVVAVASKVTALKSEHDAETEAEDAALTMQVASAGTLVADLEAELRRPGSAIPNEQLSQTNSGMQEREEEEAAEQEVAEEDLVQELVEAQLQLQQKNSHLQPRLTEPEPEPEPKPKPKPKPGPEPEPELKPEPEPEAEPEPELVSVPEPVNVSIVEMDRQAAAETSLQESNIIEAQLALIGKGIKQIRPDGDCLFGAVADQIRRVDTSVISTLIDTRDLHSRNNDAGLVPPTMHDDGTYHTKREEISAQGLRCITATTLRANPETYRPFITDNLEDYAARIEHPAVHEWGGQLELRALSDAVGCVIVVHSAGMAPLRLEPDVVVDSFNNPGSGDPQLLKCKTPQWHWNWQGVPPELHVSFHKHQYLLGEHYNSVVPIGDL